MDELHGPLIRAQLHLASNALDITPLYRLAVTHLEMGLETAFFGDWDFEYDGPNAGLRSWL